MFFIAGVQPKTISLDDHPRMCKSCGLFQARLYRVDHYISIFFLPLLRIKKGIPFIGCKSCGAVSSESEGDGVEIIKANPVNYCVSCGRPIDTGFKFCPYCGKKI